MLDLLADPGTIAEIQRFARHLAVELPALFSFFVDPDLDATNWRAEQAPAAGHHHPQGLRRRQSIAGAGPTRNKCSRSILRTAHQRGLDTTEVLTTLLRAPEPIVSPHFYPTASVN